MNKKITQVQSNLIQSLLDCPNEAQVRQILRTKLELMDNDFLQSCEQVATDLAEQGQEKQADFLQRIVNQLREFLGVDNEDDNKSEAKNSRKYVEAIPNPSKIDTEDSGDITKPNTSNFLSLNISSLNPDSQENFLVQTMFITAQGNYDGVHLFLLENQEKLDLEFANLVKNYVPKTSPVNSSEYTYSVTQTVFKLCNIMLKFQAGIRSNNVEIAIAGYEALLLVINSPLYRHEWAMIQNSLGIAYSARVKGDKIESLEKAISCYQSALTIFTQETFSQEWAMTQRNLGDVYIDRVKGEKIENIEQAITCYKNSLKIRTREAFIEKWAGIQCGLGRAYLDRAYLMRIEVHKSDNLEQAIFYYETALTFFTREIFLKEWAGIQWELGKAYLARIEGDKSDNLEQAIFYYEAALTFFTREAFLGEWAGIQWELGKAYSARIEGDKSDNLEQAISYCQSTLEISNKLVGIHGTLGYIYFTRVRGSKSKNLEQAINYYKAELEILTHISTKEEAWEITLFNLGCVYLDRIEGERIENLEQAINHYQALLDMRSREDFPKVWAMIHLQLGNAYIYRIKGETKENLDQSIVCSQSALTFFTQKDFPEDWAKIQGNLGIAYSRRIKGDEAENEEQAIIHYQSALTVFSREVLPEQWIKAQSNMGNVYAKKIKGKKLDNLEHAINCYNEALSICTYEAYPEDWMRINNGLGNAYKERIEGDKAENIEQSIIFYKAILDIYLTDTSVENWGAVAQIGLGAAYSDRIKENKDDNIEKGIAYYQSALIYYSSEAFPEMWAAIQQNLGATYWKRKKGEKAKNLEQAISYYQAALNVYTRISFPQNNVITLFGLGLAYKKLSQFQLAYSVFCDAIETVDFLRGEIQSGDETKQKLAEEWNGLYLSMVEVCIELAATDPTYYTKAIEYAERSKARNLVELLATRDLYPKGNIPATVLDQLSRLRREIDAEQRRLDNQRAARNSDLNTGERSLTLTTSAAGSDRTHLNQLQQQLSDLITHEISSIDKDFILTQEVKPIPYPEIQTLTGTNTAILEWYILNGNFLTFIITPQSPTPKVYQSSLEDFAALTAWGDRYLTDYQLDKTSWRDNLTSRLQELAEILHLKEILKQIPTQCDRLILISHRFLHLLPLHALPLADGKLLFEHFPQGVGYAPSCQLLKLAKGQEQHRPEFTRLFAIQNPTRQPARPLLGSQLEINKIHQHFDSQQSTILKEAAATEANLYQNMAQMRSSHCLHFSCHGEFNHESPLESALLLANPDGSLGTEESKLTLGEVFEKLYLNQCRLVTFSACESGMTDPNSLSDEYIGLPSGFLFAGSPSVVSTLWSVDPIATTLIMVKFYQNLHRLPHIKTGDVAIALNKAQQWLRTLTNKKLARIQNHPNFKLLVDQAFENQEDDRDLFSLLLNQAVNTKKPTRRPYPFANPYYWSAFVAIGI